MKKENKVKLKKNIIDAIEGFVKAVIYFVIALLIVKYVAQPIKVNGSSMYPNLHDGDFGISAKHFTEDDIERFDIVIIDTGELSIIKRVIGLPGDDIVYKNNVLYVNGEEVEETFLDKTNVYTEDFYCHVEKGHFFCLGDNRENSKDSRYYGTFGFEQIESKGVFLVFPLKGSIE